MTVVFPTCIADAVRPGLAARVRALLAARRGASTVTIARGTTCCGQPAYNAGYAREARRVARPTLRALARTTGDIVVPSGSCTAMVVHHWPALFAGTRDETRARAVAARVRELGVALAASGVDARTDAPATRVVAYHGSCHLRRELGVQHEPRALLEAAGCEVREPAHASLCCGFGGTFAVKLTDVSAAMADEKLDALAATGAATVVGCDLSCLVHLEGRARERGVPLAFRHLAEELGT